MEHDEKQALTDSDMIERSQHLPYDPHHDDPHSIDEPIADNLDVVYHPDLRQEPVLHHSMIQHDIQNNQKHQQHIAGNNIVHIQHIQSPYGSGVIGDKTESMENNVGNEAKVSMESDDDLAVKLVKLLQKYNEVEKARSTTGKPPVTSNSTDDDIDKWLDEILDITADDSEILGAALELYADGPHVAKAMGGETPKKHNPFHLSHVFLKKHKTKHSNRWKSTGKPTFHVKGRKSGMTFKRVLISNTTGATNSVNNQTDITEPFEYNTTMLYINGSAENEQQLTTESFESAMEIKILDYIRHNLSLVAVSPMDLESKTRENKTLIDKIVETKISVNWLIIGVCITFSVTCLCALLVGAVTVITKKRRFSADVWWNQRDQSDEEQMWLRSKSEDDIEIGANSKLQHLYSLQGEELKTQVSKMVHDIGSSSTSASSSVK